MVHAKLIAQAHSGLCSVPGASAFRPYLRRQRSVPKAAADCDTPPDILQQQPHSKAGRLKIPGVLAPLSPNQPGSPRAGAAADQPSLRGRSFSPRRKLRRSLSRELKAGELPALVKQQSAQLQQLRLLASLACQERDATGDSAAKSQDGHSATSTPTCQQAAAAAEKQRQQRREAAGLSPPRGLSAPSFPAAVPASVGHKRDANGLSRFGKAAGAAEAPPPTPRAADGAEPRLQPHGRPAVDMRRRALARAAAVKVLRQLREARAAREGPSQRPPEGSQRPAEPSAASQDEAARQKDLQRVWAAAVKLFQAQHNRRETEDDCTSRQRGPTRAAQPPSKRTKLAQASPAAPAGSQQTRAQQQVSYADLLRAILVARLRRQLAEAP